MLKKYSSEIEGMIDFWNEIGLEPDYSLNTDGRFKGNLIEFKLVFQDTKKHKEQIKRYICAYNSCAIPIPKYSYLISLNEHKYIKINNENWKEIDSNNWKEPDDFKKDFISQEDTIKGWIDEYSIVAYNNLLCGTYPKEFKTKESVKNEFINPKRIFIKPFNWNEQIKEEERNKDKIGWLHFSMNKMGPDLLTKQLGAYFTPDIYAKKSIEMVRNAIKLVPKGNDYIIFDRCAGTGNLEKFLSKEELKHCVLNTIDYTEWSTLKGLYDGRIKMLIPPTNKNINFSDGLLKDGDALSEGFYNFCFGSDKVDKEQKKMSQQLSNWLKDDKMTIIMYENPPFVEPQGGASKGKKTFTIKECYLYQEMSKDKFDTKNVNRASENLFIWSAFKYFLKQPTDSYILYSPIKYWKSQHIIDKKLVIGYICNRSNFNAKKMNDAGVFLAHWLNEDKNNEVLSVNSDLGKRKIRKNHSNPSILLKDSDKKETIAYMFNLSNVPKVTDNGNLVNIVSESYAKVQKAYNLTEENILEQLPLWVANCYRGKDYTEIEIIQKSGDGGGSYKRDKEFLNDCFIWGGLTNDNNCVSIDKTKNQYCFNQKTYADKILKKIKTHVKQNSLLDLWKKVLGYAKATNEYEETKNYGINQIEKELNIKIGSGTYNKKGEEIKVPKYTKLDESIKKLKEETKQFYNTEIVPKLFEYELLK